MTRLGNLDRLYLVPVLALRGLLTRKLADDKARLPEVKRLAREQLVQAIDREQTITENDVASLYESFRYGRRLAVQIYLLPDDYDSVIDDDTVKQAVALLKEAAPITQEGAKLDEEDDDDFSWDEVKGQVAICDHVTFGDVLEIRFRYATMHRFLNLDEEADQVLETRYGYVWLNPRHRYLTVLAKDNAAATKMLDIITKVLSVQPKAVQFPRELIDRHFDIENAMRFTHLDIATGVHQSISGDKEALAGYLGEVERRDSRYTRPSALYEETIDAGMISGIGVSAKRGRLYFTRTLSTTQVHHWVDTRLCEFVADLRATLNEQPERIYQATALVKGLRDLNDNAKMQLELILDTIASAKRKSLLTVRIAPTAESLYTALGDAWLRPCYVFSCPECEDACGFCPKCDSNKFSRDGQQLVCTACRHVLSTDGTVVTLACVNHHVNLFSIAQSTGFVATDKLRRLINRHMQELTLPWDVDRDFIYLDTVGLHRTSNPPDTMTTILGDVVRGDKVLGDKVLGDKVDRQIKTGDGT